MKKITIAIDGFSSCGKSTMAKDLAREIGYIYIDSGAMYRAVTLYSLQQGIFGDNGIDEERLRQEMGKIRISFQLNASTGRPDTYLNGVNVEQQIRTMEVPSDVSPVAATQSEAHLVHHTFGQPVGNEAQKHRAPYHQDREIEKPLPEPHVVGSHKLHPD